MRHSLHAEPLRWYANDEILPAFLAARAVGVSQRSFCYWQTAESIGLTHARVTPDGRKLFRMGDVREAERKARRSGKSHRGSRKAVDA